MAQDIIRAGVGPVAPLASPASAPPGAPAEAPGEDFRRLVDASLAPAPAGHPLGPVAPADPGRFLTPRPVAAVEVTTSVAAPATYTVQPGDSLSKIARKLGGDTSHWHQLYAANRSVVGANPDVIVPGQVLTIPAGAPFAHAHPAVQAAHAAPPVTVPAVPTTPVPAPVATFTVQTPQPAPVAAAAAVEPADPVAAPEATVPPIVVDAPERPAVSTDATLPAAAAEAIDRLALTAPAPGSLPLDPAAAPPVYQANLLTMREALRMIPENAPERLSYQRKVEGYEAALTAARAARPPEPVSALPTPTPVQTATAPPVTVVPEDDGPPAGFY